MWMDLYLAPGDRRRVTHVLFDQIRDAIASGRLAPGDRLPPTRELAADLGVSRTTLTTVYGRLVAEGWVEGRAGAGSVVTDRSVGGRDTRRTGSVLRPRRPIVVAQADPPGGDPYPAGRGEHRFDLRPGRPDPALFPLTEWRRCVTSTLQTPPPGYGDTRGLPALRSAIAHWVGRSRAVVADADQIVVTAGAQQAFDLCARALLVPGDVAAIEDPGYPPIRRLFELHGARVVPVPVDAEGIVVSEIPTEARIVHVTPSHQFPTGVTMSAQRRRDLLDLADRHGIAILEDDYDTEYRHVDRPLEPIHRLDTAGRVVYVGTFSKTLSPSLRLGFAVVPDSLVDAVAASRAAVDVEPPHHAQAALAELIVSGGHDRHLRRTRRVYRERHRLVAELAERAHAAGAALAPVGGNAGLHVAIRLAPGLSEVDVTVLLDPLGVAVGTLSPTFTGVGPGAASQGLLVGFGPVATDDLAVALAHLDDSLRRLV